MLQLLLVLMCVCSPKDVCVACCEWHWLYEALHVHIDDRLQLLAGVTVAHVLRLVTL
jgi:hypothetical protein